MLSSANVAINAPDPSGFHKHFKRKQKAFRDTHWQRNTFNFISSQTSSLTFTISVFFSHVNTPYKHYNSSVQEFMFHLSVNTTSCVFTLLRATHIHACCSGECHSLYENHLSGYLIALHAQWASTAAFTGGCCRDLIRSISLKNCVAKSWHGNLSLCL